MNVHFINGSPKGESGCSAYLIGQLRAMFSPDVRRAQYDAIKLPGQEEKLAEALAADALVFVFPLYIDSIPAPLHICMDALRRALPGQFRPRPAVYAVVNCGFYESAQTAIALRVVENFCAAAGLEYKFGAGIGGGAFIAATKQIPLDSFIKKPAYRALRAVQTSIESGGRAARQNQYANLRVPRRLFIYMANCHWRGLARTNGLKPGDLYARP